MRYRHEDKNKYFKVCPCPLAPARRRQAPRHDGTCLGVNVNQVLRHSKHTCFPRPQCNQPNCSLTFRKRKMFKVHLKEHEVPPNFKYVQSNPVKSNCKCVKKNSPTEQSFSRLNGHDGSRLSSCFRCTNDGCGATFGSHAARKAHEKKHAGWSILVSAGVLHLLSV